MSALPNFPLYDQEPPREPEPRPRRTWKKIVGWTFAGIGILLLLLVVAVVVLLHNASFHRYVLSTALQKTSAALGTRVQARDYKLSWSGISPSLDLYDAVIDGAPPYATPPLLQLPHAHLAVRVTSLLHRTWYIDDVTLDSPVVRVYSDAQGNNNLPKPKSSGQSKTDMFDLGIRHIVLNNGEAIYNNRKSALDADLHDLNFRAGFDPSQTKYSGTLEYHDGVVKMANYQPLHSDLSAKFWLTRDQFVLEDASLVSGKSRFVLNATVHDYAKNPQVQATYDAVVDSGQFRALLKNPSLPIGLLHAQGRLDYTARPNVPMMDAAVLSGTLSSANLAVNTPSFRGDVRNLAAHYTLANGNLVVRDLHANTLGGAVTGTATMQNLAGNTRSNVNLDLRNISVAAAKQQVNAPSLRNVNAAGTLNGNVTASWGKTMNDLVANANLDINAQAAPAGQQMMPITGAIHARYDAATKSVSFQNSSIRTPAGVIALNGTLSNRSALALNIDNVDLAQIEKLAGMDAASAPRQLGLAGIASFSGSVRGSTATPELIGLLVVHNLQVKGTTWPLFRANVDAKPSGATLRNALLTAPNGGHINFDVDTVLRNWSFTDQSQFRVNLAATNIDAGNLTKAAGLSTPVSGTVNANLDASGTELNPVGQGNVALTRASVSGQPIQSLNVKFNGTGDRVNANLSLALPGAGNATGTLVYFPKQKGYDAQLRALGIRLDQLQAIKQKNLDLHGVLNLTASGRGTLDNPGGQARLEIPQLRVKNQTMNGLLLNATVQNHVANFDLNSQAMNVAMRGRGTVALTAPYFANATLDTAVIPFAPLIAVYMPSQAGNITGQTELHATLRGPLQNKNQIEAHITIPQLAVDYKKTVQLAAAAPIHADYANGLLNVQRATIRGTGTDLQFQGSIPTTAGTAPMSLMLVGTVDLRLAQIIDPEIASGGQLVFDVNGYGQRANPNVQGQVKIVNASFASGDIPLGLQNGNGVLELTKDRLNIKTFQGTVGGGTLTASGGVTYRPTLAFDVAVKGNGIRLLYQDAVRTGFDTNLVLTGTPDAATLRGQVQVDRLSFTPDFDLMSFMGTFGGVSTPPPAQGFSTNLALDLGIHSTTGVNLVSRTLSVAGTANLRVTGTAAQPVVLGRINLNGGDVILMGNRYVLQGGTVDFVNPAQTMPVLDVSVNTTVQQYNIQMHFWGPADHLHTNYASDPALPPSDIINLIAFGKTTEASAANPTPPGALGAESLIASQVAGQVTSRLEKFAGISQLSIDPELGGNGNGQTQTPGARIAVQQRVTSKIFVTFATDVTSTQNQVIKLEYQVSPRVSVNVVRDQNGGFAVDTRIRKTW